MLFVVRALLRTADILQDSQSLLAETCLVYMSFDDFCTTLSSPGERDGRLEQYPFLKDAANHWGGHVADHVSRSVRGDVHSRAWEFLSDTAKLRSAFLVMSGFPFEPDPLVIGLHIAAYF